MDHWAWQHLSDWLEIRVEMRIGALLCVVDGPTEGRPWSPTAARATLRQLAVSAGVRRRFAPHLEANTMRSRPDESEWRRYAALMRELIALAEELRRGFGSCLLDGRLPTSRRRLCQSFPVGITVAGSTISKTVRPCARGR